MKGFERIVARFGEDAFNAWVDRADRWIARGAWFAIAAAIVYFGPICIGILLR
jgi:hypothetical protein